MSLLVYLFHPDYDKSTVNRAYVEELKRLPGTEVVIVDGKAPIDVPAEQARMERHEKVLWQFPVRWFSGPPCFCSFLEKVYLPGWAYACEPSAMKLAGKRVWIAASFGSPDSDEKKGWPATKITEAMRIILNYTGQKFEGFFATRGATDLKGYLQFVEDIRK